MKFARDAPERQLHIKSDLLVSYDIVYSPAKAYHSRQLNNPDRCFPQQTPS